MLRLDELYKAQKDRGLIVFGLSDQDFEVQRKYLEQVPVSYPLLTFKGEVPRLYRDIARYPAIFLIDRRGRLQPAPSPDRPFEEFAAAVVVLLQDAANLVPPRPPLPLEHLSDSPRGSRRRAGLVGALPRYCVRANGIRAAVRADGCWRLAITAQLVMSCVLLSSRIGM